MCMCITTNKEEPLFAKFCSFTMVSPKHSTQKPPPPYYYRFRLYTTTISYSYFILYCSICSIIAKRFNSLDAVIKKMYDLYYIRNETQQPFSE